MSNNWKEFKVDSKLIVFEAENAVLLKLPNDERNFWVANKIFHEAEDGKIYKVNYRDDDDFTFQVFETVEEKDEDGKINYKKINETVLIGREVAELFEA